MSGTRLAQECHPRGTRNLCHSSSVFTHPGKRSNFLKSCARKKSQGCVRTPWLNLFKMTTIIGIDAEWQTNPEEGQNDVFSYQWFGLDGGREWSGLHYPEDDKRLTISEWLSLALMEGYKNRAWPRTVVLASHFTTAELSAVKNFHTLKSRLDLVQVPATPQPDNRSPPTATTTPETDTPSQCTCWIPCSLPQLTGEVLRHWENCLVSPRKNSQRVTPKIRCAGSWRRSQSCFKPMH